jgi:hypothetical protein
MPDSPTSANVARGIGALAALALLVAVIFLLNSPVADTEAEPSSGGPAVATLECGRPWMHDRDALLQRQWSSTPSNRDGSAPTGEDVRLCLDLVDEHVTRAWVMAGVAGATAAVAVLVAAGGAAVSRRSA